MPMQHRQHDWLVRLAGVLSPVKRRQILCCSPVLFTKPSKTSAGRRRRLSRGRKSLAAWGISNALSHLWRSPTSQFERSRTKKKKEKKKSKCFPGFSAVGYFTPKIGSEPALVLMYIILTRCWSRPDFLFVAPYTVFNASDRFGTWATRQYRTSVPRSQNLFIPGVRFKGKCLVLLTVYTVEFVCASVVKGL